MMETWWFHRLNTFYWNLNWLRHTWGNGAVWLGIKMVFSSGTSRAFLECFLSPGQDFPRNLKYVLLSRKSTTEWVHTLTDKSSCFFIECDHMNCCAATKKVPAWNKGPVILSTCLVPVQELLINPFSEVESIGAEYLAVNSLAFVQSSITAVSEPLN